MGHEQGVTGAEGRVTSGGTDGTESNIGAQEQGRSTALGTQGLDGPETRPTEGPLDWRGISGFVAGEEWKLSPEQRTVGLRKLFVEVLRMMREEMEFQAAPISRYIDVDEWDWLKPFTLDFERKKVAPPGKYVHEMERTYLWDPVRAVSMRLNIPMCKLSNLSKMYSGMSVLDMADRMRAQKLKPLFWGIMRKFTLKLWNPAGATDFNRSMDELVEESRRWGRAMDSAAAGHRTAEDEGRDDPTWCPQFDTFYKDSLPGPNTLLDKLWGAWKKFKRSVEFDKEVWAHECGFASYARMRKACYLEYGVSPQTLEHQIAFEIATYYDAAQNRNERERMIADPTIPSHMKPKAPYRDTWGSLEQLSPKWMGKMKKLFGLMLNWGPKEQQVGVG